MENQNENSPSTLNEADLTVAASIVGSALRKLAQAASMGLGADCFAHALLGQALLSDLNIRSEVTLGCAAWRVGEEDGAVVTHAESDATNFASCSPNAFHFHAWLVCGNFIVDFTTYQLGMKLEALDAMDGQHTTIDWCPDFLVLSRDLTRSFKEVATLTTGLSYYLARPDLLERHRSKIKVDQDDLSTARIIMANPHVHVFGPANMPALSAGS